MNLLLNTCAFLWLTLSPQKLSQNAKAAFSEQGNYIFLSTISAWEISIKYGRKGLVLTSPPRIFIPQKCLAQGIEILPLELSAALRVNELPTIHRDPFDRILMAQAMTHDLTIITADDEIRKYPVKTIW